MVMLSRDRIFEVLRDRVAIVLERSPGYRDDLATALIEVLQVEDSGSSERGRRERVRRIIEAASDRVHAAQREAQ